MTAIFYVMIIALAVAYDVIYRPGYCSSSLKDKTKTSVTCWRITEVLKLSIFAFLMQMAHLIPMNLDPCIKILPLIKLILFLRQDTNEIVVVKMIR